MNDETLSAHDKRILLALAGQRPLAHEDEQRLVHGDGLESRLRVYYSQRQQNIEIAEAAGVRNELIALLPRLTKALETMAHSELVRQERETRRFEMEQEAIERRSVAIWGRDGMALAATSAVLGAVGMAAAAYFGGMG